MVKLVDFIITSKGEKISGKGEDNDISIIRDDLGVLGVFDGCGGIGSKKYAQMDNLSGAYLASKVAKNATEKWFEQIDSFEKKQGDALADKLKEGLIKELKKIPTGESVVKGSLIKEFPTTVSLILFKADKKSILAEYIWAGDSRAYVLEPSGLVQLTRDDIVGGGDAFDNLKTDARLSNFVSASGDFKLHKRIAEIELPAMLICATDGCFGYFKTPMEFEYVILSALQEAENEKDWENCITSRLEEMSGDDFSLKIAIIGCGNFKSIKKAFKKRGKTLFKDYISEISKANDRELLDLWEEYKEDYYG